MTVTVAATPSDLVVLAHDVDVFAARRCVRAYALALGFDVVAVAELVIVVSELSWNVLRHGGGGHVVMSPVSDDERGGGLRVDAHDRGPPFHDFRMALRDGFDDRGPIDPARLHRRGGLAGGLGAVSRLSDRLEHIATAGTAGKVIRATRYRARRRARTHPLFVCEVSDD